MKLEQTGLPGLFVVRPDMVEDDRGSFGRIFDRAAFASAGLPWDVVQCSLSHNTGASTLRGLHYQLPPHQEEKIVRCVSGRIFDVAVDLRASSPTYLKWHAEELSATNRLALAIPAGFAHGFLTLEPGAEVLYQITAAHVPGAGAGVRWDDPRLAISWPAEPLVMSRRDAELPRLGDPGQVT